MFLCLFLLKRWWKVLESSAQRGLLQKEVGVRIGVVRLKVLLFGRDRV